MNTRTIISGSLLTLVVVVAVFLVDYRADRLHTNQQEFPYGDRRALLRNLYSALMTYASEHEGAFSFSDAGSEIALSKLYPDYCATAVELAGLTGDSNAVAKLLKPGKPITTNASSWRYQQGLRVEDNPSIAIVWEQGTDVYASSRIATNASRAVVTIGGIITNVPLNLWEAFLVEQSTLLQKRAP